VHKAFNSVIQGTAADIMKMKLVELHKARHETGFILRFTVHDEVDGDSPDKKCAEMVNAILNRQSVETSVPILWEVSTGSNWANVEDSDDEFSGAHETDTQRQTTQDLAKAGWQGPLPVSGRLKK
jgi:DNA polymerase-1